MGKQEPAPRPRNWELKSMSTRSAPLGWSCLALIAAMMIALGPEIKALESWTLGTTPEFIGHNINVIGGVLMAWVSGFLRNSN